MTSVNVVRVEAIFVRQDWIEDGPSDAEGRIVPSDAVAALRGVELAHLIEDLYVVGEGLKAVGATFWNVYSIAIVFGQLERFPLSIRLRIGTKVKNHVID